MQFDVEARLKRISSENHKVESLFSLEKNTNLKIQNWNLRSVVPILNLCISICGLPGYAIRVKMNVKANERDSQRRWRCAGGGAITSGVGGLQFLDSGMDKEGRFPFASLLVSVGCQARRRKLRGGEAWQCKTHSLATRPRHKTKPDFPHSDASLHSLFYSFTRILAENCKTVLIRPISVIFHEI